MERLIGKRPYEGACCHALFHGYTSVCPFCVPFNHRELGVIHEIYIPDQNSYYAVRAESISWKGIPAYVEYVQDITAEVMERKEKESLFKKYQATVKNTPGGLVIMKMTGPGRAIPVFASEGFLDICQMTRDQYESTYDGNVFGGVHPADLPRVHARFDNLKKSGDRFSDTYRLVRGDGSYSWIQVTSTLMEEEGDLLLYAGYLDVTDQVKVQQEMQSIYDNIPGAVFRCRYTPHWEIMEANDGFFEFIGYSRREFAAMGGRMSTVIYPEDLGIMYDLVTMQLKEGVLFENENRLICKDGAIKWVSVKGHLMRDDQGEAFLYCVFVEITKQKQSELALQAEKEKTDVVLKNSDVTIWEYNITKKIAYQKRELAQDFGLPMNVESMPMSIVENGVVEEDSVEELVALYREIETMAETNPHDIQLNNAQGNSQWYRMTMRRLPAEEGGDLIAIGWGIDITKEKEAQRHFEEELRYQEATTEANLLVKVRANLTKGIVERYIASKNIGIAHDGMDYETGVEALAKTGLNPENQEKIRTMLNRKRVFAAFDEGEREYSLDYQRRANDGQIIWVNSTIKTYRDLKSGDIMSFMYTYDIDAQYTMKLIVDKITDIDYEFIALVDVQTHQLTIVRDSTLKTYQGKYDEALADFVEEYIQETQRTKVLRELSVAVTKAHLKKEDVYSYVTNMNVDGKPRHKKWELAYMDDSQATILIIRSDITNLVAHQEKQQTRLNEALTLATEANRAKSNFLSSMSHDIRTPMNAIVGMTELALSDLTDAEQVAESLTTIKSSSDQLLALINDVLDMSRIESGRITMVQERFINTVEYEKTIRHFNGLIQAKNITFDHYIHVTHDHCYGDAVRFHRMIDNLLGNAVKFTPPGGRISYCYEEYPSDKHHIGNYRITVSDTGIGMEKEMVRHIFEPFFRDKDTRVERMEGTGLGLAIVKGIVDFCGGTIQVSSEAGVGSTFVVDLPIRLDSDTQEKEPKRTTKPQESYAIKGLHLLVAEDHPVNQKVVRRILEKVGVTLEMVANGETARDQFITSAAGTFDAILMDIQMPVMNGYDATRAIRASRHPQAKTIPIIAMTANAFAEDVKNSMEAGMDYHLPKPITPKRLYAVLEEHCTPGR